MKNPNLLKTTFVLKNGENSIEFPSRKVMLSYYKRFLKLFPDVDCNNIVMFKVNVYQIPLENGKTI